MKVAWLSLLLASCLEVCWIYTLKVLDMKKIFQIKPVSLFNDIDTWMAILPLLGYIIFGLSNVLAITRAMKYIPASTAFAVWMGLAMVATKAIDILYLKQPYNYQQILFTALVLIGIIGLKWFE